MNDTTFECDQTEEEILTCNVSDEALEAAAGRDGVDPLLMTTNPWGFVC